VKPPPTSNLPATSAAQLSLYEFGSKLQFAANCAFCAIVGSGLWLVARSLFKQVGDVAALALYVAVGSLLVALWGVHWKQEIKVAADGLVVWHGLFRRHEFLKYDNLSTVLVSGSTLEVRLIGGRSVQLVRIRSAKYSQRLAELAQQIERNVVRSA